VGRNHQLIMKSEEPHSDDQGIGRRLALYRVVDEDGVCFRISPGMSESCRHPGEEGVDLGDIILGSEGPPGWIRTFPENFFIPLTITGKPVLERARLRTTKTKTGSNKAEKEENSQNLITKLRLALHGDDHHSSSESSDLDVDDLGGAIDHGGYADINEERKKGRAPPSVPIAIGMLRVTIQEIAHQKNRNHRHTHQPTYRKSSDKKLSSHPRKAAAPPPAAATTADDSTGTLAISQHVLTGVGKLIPEWVHSEKHGGWIVLRIALHLFNISPDPMKQCGRRRLNLPQPGAFVAKYELEGSLVEADPKNIKTFIVHLPGKFHRIIIECPESEAAGGGPSNNSHVNNHASGSSSGDSSSSSATSSALKKIFPVALPTVPRHRGQWLGLIAMCSGPPELIDVGSTLRAMLALLVSRIEDEGRLNTMNETETREKLIQNLHNHLSEISRWISDVALNENKNSSRDGKTSSSSSSSEPSKSDTICMVRVELKGYGSSTSQCRLHETIAQIKLNAITQLVEKRRPSLSTSSSSSSPPPLSSSSSQQKQQQSSSSSSSSSSSLSSGQQQQQQQHKRASLKTKDYRLLILGRGRPIHCDESETLQNVTERSGVSAATAKNSSSESATPAHPQSKASKGRPVLRLSFTLEPVADDEPTINRFHKTEVLESHFPVAETTMESTKQSEISEQQLHDEDNQAAALSQSMIASSFSKKVTLSENDSQKGHLPKVGAKKTRRRSFWDKLRGKKI